MYCVHHGMSYSVIDGLVYIYCLAENALRKCYCSKASDNVFNETCCFMSKCPLVRPGVRPGFEQKKSRLGLRQVSDLLKTCDKLCESRESVRPKKSPILTHGRRRRWCCVLSDSVIYAENQKENTVWMKRYLRDRTKYGVLYALLSEILN